MSAPVHPEARAWDAFRAREATTARVHLVASLLVLTLGSASLALGDADAAAWQRAVPLVAMAAYPVLIMGTTRLLVSGMAGRAFAGSGPVAYLPATLTLAGAVAAWLTLRGVTVLLPLSTLWALGMVAHAALVVLTLRRPRQAPIPTAPDRGRLARRVLEAASIAFGLAAAIAWPLALAGAVPLPVAIHLLLPGFVLLTIAATASHVLPRFTGVPFPSVPLAFLAAALPAGAGLLSWGLIERGPAFRIGAALETLGLATLAGSILWMAGRAVRRRDVLVAYAAAAACLLGGVGLGASFAFEPSMLRLVPLHALLNLLGFVGLLVLGASLDIYAPSLWAGARGFRRHVRLVLALGVGGLLLASGGLLADALGLARAGLWVLTAAFGLQAVGALLLLARSRRRHSLRIGLVPPAAPRVGEGPR